MTDEREQRIARLKELTERTLPMRARELDWPIRLDHCFKRICFDAAFDDVWYRHVPRPAEKHLAGEALTKALRCAEELVTGDRALLDVRNRDSLRWRGKLREQR